ncbi:MAG: YitT family protein [Prevotellaceae bacterium]|jgi:uncharacterized membrane-anchored protein YitT (DUF2179 family)|nr:YitT family protein [Prevotellaceae bacterium]
MVKLVQEKMFSKKWFVSYTQIFIGSFAMAVAVVLFISPYKLAPGGVYGISIMLHHLYDMYHETMRNILGMNIPTNLDISVVAICMDIPLCLLGVKMLGPIFGVKTVVSFSSLAVFTFVLENSWGYEAAVDDAMLSSIFGAVCLGLGCGLIFRANATSGGTDVISMVLSRKFHIPLGNMVIMVDSCVVLISLVAFQDLKIPLYSFIVIYITGQIINTTMYGFKRIKTMFIISEKHEDIARFIIELDRGGTILYGEGMYTNEKKSIIFSNVNPREVNIIQKYIREVDPGAFITVIDANQVVGEGRGFHNIHEIH